MFSDCREHKTAFPPFLQGDQDLKIKCKKCGRHFDAEMYSGLCPKCGTYNGAHRAAAKREEPGLTAAKREVPVLAAAKRKVSGLTAALAVLLVVVPIVSMVSYRLWERQKIGELLSGEIGQVSLQDGNTLVFSGELFEAPVKVEVLGTGIAKGEELARAGKMLFMVLADASSERYSFDAKLNSVALKYERDGKIFYQEPTDYYDMEDYLPRLGLTRIELLATYGIGNGEEQRGYWIFCVDEDAENPELLLMAQDNGSAVFLEGTIPLESFVSEELLLGEAAP